MGAMEKRNRGIHRTVVVGKSRRGGGGVIALALVSLLTAMCAGAHAVEVEMKMRLCEETNSICSWYKAVITPPTGWEEDATYGDRNLVTVDATYGDRNLVTVFAPSCIIV